MAIDVASLIPSIVGLGIKTGTAIPGLKKPKRVQAQPIATRLGGQILGASQAGHGGSRGLALREGIRGAAQAAGNIAGVQEQANLSREAMYQNQLQQRNQNLATFGTDLAKGLGDMAAISIGPKGEPGAGDTAFRNANPAEAQAQAMQTLPTAGRPQEAPATLQSSQIGLGQSAGDIAGQMQSMQQMGQMPQAAPGPASNFQFDPVSHVLQGSPPRVMPQVEQELAFKLDLQRLALDQAERMGMDIVKSKVLLDKQLGLSLGSSMANPYGAAFDFSQYDQGQ